MSNQALPYGRMYYPVEHPEFFSERAFNFLEGVYGRSAASTYMARRRWHGASVMTALIWARRQADDLGKSYQGGPECVKYRLSA